ncbi:MAG: hypothetical protein J5562_03840, partial [Clostridia bacterium]|nr:hypothetical protein [Clostridia bacterium]
MTMKRFSSTKRIISLALAMIMALGVCTAGIPGIIITASADIWSGTISDPGTEYVASGSTVHLYSARALVWFINRIYNGNDFSGVTVYLDTDVDLNNQDFVGKSVFPYSDSRYFRGTFDGQGHTISNFKMTDGNHRVAMFRQTESATFRNVTFTNVNISSSGDYSGHAVLVGYHKSGNLTFENVHVTSGSISGYRWIGALVGEVDENSGRTLTMTNCSNGATITGRNTRVGGLAGSCLPAVNASNCSNTGNVSSNSTDIGGIVGWIEDDASSFSGCSNSGSISGTDAVGGIIGYFGNNDQDKRMTLTNNTNTGTITSSGRAGGIAGHIETDNNAHIISGNINRGKVTAGTDAGGIVGRNKGFGTWTNNKNYGEIYGGDNAGGICGEVEDDLQTYNNCHNYGTISGVNSIGGITGFGNNGEQNFTNCTNSGNITSTANAAGGLYGVGHKEVRCTECWNIGTVTAAGDGGGLVGYVDYHTFYTRCWNAGSVGPISNNSTNSYGGMVGYTSYYGNDTNQVMVVDCYNWGMISGGYVGGFVGYVNDGQNYKITYSYNTGYLAGTVSTWQFAGYGGNCGDGCYKNVNVGSGTYKTDQEFIDYNFSIDNNFKKNSEGVTVNGVTYYFPILGWCENSMPAICYNIANWTAHYTANDGLYYTCDTCGERMNSECPISTVPMTALPTAAGSTLQDGAIYNVESSRTVSGTRTTNGLVVAERATVIIYIPDGVTLTVNGGDASANEPGKAGIYVPTSSTLIIAGNGSLTAKGGNGGQGSNGYNGGSPTGGQGGTGGAGGGAGIGGNGGNGGTGGPQQTS